eukprot:10275-Heterococcus_DN1.PRE.1
MAVVTLPSSAAVALPELPPVVATHAQAWCTLQICCLALSISVCNDPSCCDVHAVCNTRECANTLPHTSAFRSTCKYHSPSLLPAVAAVSSPPKYCRGSAREPFCAAASWQVALNGCFCSRWSLVAVVVAVVLLPSRLPPSAMCS